MGTDDLASELRSRSLRATPQRRAILGAFDGGEEEHLSVEEIHARASSRVPGVGRGTVYATLAELAEAGLLASVGNHDPIRYETNVAPHDHFRCGLCLRIFDVDMASPSTTTLTRKGFAVDHVAVFVEGTCAPCRDYAKGLEDGAATAQRERLVSPDVLERLSCTRHDTVLGPLLVGASADGVVRVAFDHQADFAALSDRARSRRGRRAARDRVDACLASIDGYLDGGRAQADALVDWSLVGEAERRPLESTRRIPWGERRSYHDLRVDMEPYACGFALGTNPLPLLFPCHRVTQGQRISAAYAGGTANRDVLDHLEHPSQD